MSQFYVEPYSGSGGTPITTLDGDTGSATGATILISGGTTGLTTAASGSTVDLTGILALASGGTGQNLAAVDNAVMITSSLGAVEFLANGTAGYVLTAQSGAPPAWAPIPGGTGVTYTLTPVNHAASPYTVLNTDEYLKADSTAGTISILLPNSTTTGRSIVIKDSTGQASTHAIAVTTVGGAVTIDGQTTYTMNIAYQSITVVFDGTNYEVI